MAAMRFDAALLDCNGVWVDSESNTNGVLRDVLNESGWALSHAECMRIFIGNAVRDERPRIEAETGQPLTADWMGAFCAWRDARLRTELSAIDGALQPVTTATPQAALPVPPAPTGSRC